MVAERFSMSILLANRSALAAEFTPPGLALGRCTITSGRSIKVRRTVPGMAQRSRKARSVRRLRNRPEITSRLRICVPLAMPVSPSLGGHWQSLWHSENQRS